MAIEYFPFDAGAGANVAEDQWRKMARYWMPTGIIKGAANEGAVGERALGANMSVDVDTFEAFVEGHYASSDAVENLPISDADPVLARIDYVVIRADFVANTVGLAVVEGTPASPATIPALTQSSAVWEVPLATVHLEGGEVTVFDADVLDRRQFVYNGYREEFVAVSVNLGNLAAHTGENVTVDVPGLEVGDRCVLVGAELAASQQLRSDPICTVAGQINVRRYNADPNPSDPAASNFHFRVTHTA